MADKAAAMKLEAYCHICAIHCSSACQLCEHVVGNKHRAVAKRVSPDCLPDTHRLQYFFDTYMKLYPLVGLEYMEEMQQANGCQHTYKCLLCGFYGDRKLAYLHVTGSHHITNFIDKHYPDLSVNSVAYHQKNEYVKALQKAAAKAYADCGRQKITEIVNDSNPGSTPAKPSSDPKTASTTAAATTTSSGGNGGLNSKSRRKEKREQERLTGFKGNGDFFEYLQKFEIRDYEDAWVIRRIMLNCTRALERFRQEQERPSREAPQNREAPQSREAPPLAYRTHNIGANVVAPAAASQPQNDSVTALFFSSIKNMEESEVVSMLRNIAATNPAFSGIDVPNAIKYLQATGRLKTS